MQPASPATSPPPATVGLISLGGSPRERVDRGAERRVVLLGIAGSGLFLAAAIITWLAGIARDGRWAPLHLALAGAASLAIGTLLPHFTVSLAVARPVAARWRYVSLGMLAAGASLAVVGVSAGNGLLGAAGGALFIAGIAGTALCAFLPARAGLGRRGGVVELGYALSLVSVAAGVGLAFLDLAGFPAVTTRWSAFKPAHAWLNLMGFVTLVVATTLIHLYPTVVGSRIRPRMLMLAMVGGLFTGATVVAIGYALGSDLLARLGALVALGGAVAALLVALDARRERGQWTADLAWHRFTIGHLSAAIAWLVIGVGIAAAAVLANGSSPAGWSIDRLIGPLLVGCVVQVLIGAWSHLAPAVGPGDVVRHARQRRVLGTSPIPRLAALNLGAALVTLGGLGLGGAMVAVGAVLVVGSVVVALALLAVAILRS